LRNLCEQVEVYLGIKRSRLDRAMTQDVGDTFEPNVLSQQLAGDRMSKHMSATYGRLNAGTLEGCPSDVCDGMSGLTSGEARVGGP
jgi:hypothetical protein